MLMLSFTFSATIVDFVELYFEIIYPIFPLFHRPSFVRRVSRGEYTSDKPLFISIMAICALVAGRVRDGSVTNPRWDLSSLQGLDADISTSYALMPLLAIAAIQNGRIRDLHRHLGIYHMLVDIYGLHDESNWPDHAADKSHFLFWSTYTLDVFQSVVWRGTIRSREQQIPSLTNASLSMNKASPSFSNSSRNQRDCWLIGWNFITDLYRVLEQALTRFRGNQYHQITVTATSVSDSAVQMYVNLPESFKQTLQMTYDTRKDLFGLKAANITASLHLLRIIFEVISAFISIPVGYLIAIGTPLLHHLGGIGAIPGAVLEELLRENEYSQVRTVMLSMAQLLDNLESIDNGARVIEKLRTQVSRIDEYMNTQRHIASLQQDTIQSNLFPNSSCHGSVHNGQINHDMNENWSFTFPLDLLSDLNWNFDIGLGSCRFYC
ncbi:hypothetical protein EV127DRAFT_457483 [Xylaria flabelliformis]|nr:hypothetical protein EV127DRAFT_457483 [Xylaria flabelliformis]